ncbi:hypothetical protein BJ508DRAFT_321308 [Ascobolus immersus RN42]|uniref:F-box domain-containing protein n=1 Tax=Ascobolus immersus RN42 TaxID=1160509 RepID=A0A3N4IMS6_ASCIM|nr:hypothetical protein BJ508DRAFT_321308 [Ascobolus immersus RN42]
MSLWASLAMFRRSSTRPSYNTQVQAPSPPPPPPQSTLPRLPRELQLQIFTHLSTPHDLLALLRTHPSLHSTFITYEKSICPTLARRAYPPGVLDILNILRSPVRVTQRRMLYDSLFPFAVDTSPYEPLMSTYNSYMAYNVGRVFDSPDEVRLMDLAMLAAIETEMVQPYVLAMVKHQEGEQFPLAVTASERARIRAAFWNVLRVYKHCHSLIHDVNGALERDENGDVVVMDLEVDHRCELECLGVRHTCEPPPSEFQEAVKRGVPFLNTAGILEDFSIEEHLHMLNIHYTLHNPIECRYPGPRNTGKPTIAPVVGAALFENRFPWWLLFYALNQIASFREEAVGAPRELDARIRPYACDEGLSPSMASLWDYGQATMRELFGGGKGEGRVDCDGYQLLKARVFKDLDVERTEVVVLMGRDYWLKGQTLADLRFGDELERHLPGLMIANMTRSGYEEWVDCPFGAKHFGYVTAGNSWVPEGGAYRNSDVDTGTLPEHLGSVPVENYCINLLHQPYLK